MGASSSFGAARRSSAVSSPATTSTRERLFDAGAAIRSYDVTADGKVSVESAGQQRRPAGRTLVNNGSHKQATESRKH